MLTIPVNFALGPLSSPHQRASRGTRVRLQPSARQWPRLPGQAGEWYD